MNEPLVLLPDMGADASLWRGITEPLSAVYPVMFVPVTMAERAEEIASDLLTMLPQRFALAGHGLGSIVALEVLRRAGNRVTRVALMSAYPLAEPPDVAAEREARIIAASTGRVGDAVHSELGTWGFGPDPAKVALRSTLQQVAEALGPDVFRRQSRLMQRRRDQTQTLSGIKQPALVLCGAHDAAAPAKRHEWMAEMIPYSDLRVIEDAGHAPMIETPGVVLSAIAGWMAEPLLLR